MVQYSLFMLKVPLNPSKQTNPQLLEAVEYGWNDGSFESDPERTI